MTVEHLEEDERLQIALASLTVPPARQDFWASVRAGLEPAAEADPGPALHSLETIAPSTDLATASIAGPFDGGPKPVNGTVQAPGANPRSPDRLRFLALAAGLCLIAGLGAILAMGGGQPAVVATDRDQSSPEPATDDVAEDVTEDLAEDVAEDGIANIDGADDHDVDRGSIEFEPGQTSATVTGRIEGQQVDVWTFVAQAGQTGEVDVQQEDRTDLTGTFVIWGPDGDTVPTDHRSDEVASFVLPADGQYQLRLLRYRAGLRPEGSFSYTTTLTIDALVTMGNEALIQEAGTARLTIGTGVDQPYELEGCTIEDGLVTAGLSDMADADSRIDLFGGELVISDGSDDIGTAEMVTIGPIVEIVGELETAGPFRLVIFGCEER